MKFALAAISIIFIYAPPASARERSCPEYSRPMCMRGERLVVEKDPQGCSRPTCKSNFTEALDGKKFCRTVERGGMFGQPRGSAEHCVSFSGGHMHDNANTFFGNPPETKPYKVEDDVVLALDKGDWESVYRIEGDTLKNEVGTVLKLSDEPAETHTPPPPPRGGAR